MKKFKAILFKWVKEKIENENLRNEFAHAGETMLKFSHHMLSLVCSIWG
jgi:hypothetical protein